MKATDYVSYGTAKLLKSAGFDKKTKHGYTEDGLFLEYSADYPAPHLYTAMKWLREEHKMPIDIVAVPLDMQVDKKGVGHTSKYEYAVVHTQLPRFQTYEQAADAGISVMCECIAKRSNA